MTTPEGQAAAEQAQVLEAISELTTRWGYRDVTDLLRAYNEHLRDSYPEEERPTFDYLCVLQTPEGGPVYCSKAWRLLRELEEARATGHRWEQCPAPDPQENLWLVVGNFDLDEDEDEEESARL